MIVKSLEYENFRNLKKSSVSPCDGVNLIYGQNAQGKTNLIEAIWLFSGNRSFRSSKDNELISFGGDFFKISLDFISGGRDQKCEITFTPEKKEIILNSVVKNTASELFTSFCCVVFSPEHLSLVKGGPAERRKFIDNAICQKSKIYYSALSEYNKILFQRNNLLKEIYYNKDLLDTLDIWDELLAKKGAQIIEHRLAFLKRLAVYAEKFHRGISDGTEALSLGYSVNYSGKADEIYKDIYENIIKTRQEDLRDRYTNTGPHRDDIDILINNIKARSFSSQGQQRSAVLSLKLAEAALLCEMLGENPVILLDDVLSELDLKRQEYLLSNLTESQVFITCCDKKSAESLNCGKTFHIFDGEVETV